MRATIAIVLILQLFEPAPSAKILGVFLSPSISHQVVYQPVWKELSLRGHQVTVLSPNPLKDETLTNLTEIDLGFAYEEIISKNFIGKFIHKTLLYDRYLSMMDAIQDMLYYIIESPPVKALLEDKSRSFDLIVMEAFNPIVHGFVARYQVPFVALLSAGGLLNNHDSVGNPTHPVLYPDLFMEAGDGSLLDRIRLTYGEITMKMLYKYWILPSADRLARKAFGNHIPYVGDIERNCSLLIFNSNPILYSPRPNVPSIVEIQQMHIKDNKPLPKVSS